MDLDKAPSALYEHCLVVYDKMSKEAKMELLDGEELDVYEGFLTSLFKDVGLSVPYYTQVVRMLRAMNCVTQIRRGGGASPSRWVMHFRPDLESFNVAKELPEMIRPSKSAMVDQALKDLNTRLISLEDRLSKAGL